MRIYLEPEPLEPEPPEPPPAAPEEPMLPEPPDELDVLPGLPAPLPPEVWSVARRSQPANVMLNAAATSKTFVLRFNDESIVVLS